MRRISWTGAVYSGQDGASEGSCHMAKDDLLYLCTVNFDGQVRHGSKPILDLAWACSGSDPL